METNKAVLTMNYKELATIQLKADMFDKQQLPNIVSSLHDSDTKTKMITFLRVANNPYLFWVGNIGVHVALSGNRGSAKAQ